jgi:hypothetical protein
MAAPLNPILYSLLKQKFGEVLFGNEGCPAYYERLPDPFNPRRTVVRASSWGEYYCVCCPFCNDKRNRLWVNHVYASTVSKEGRREMTHLATCYNEDCTSRPGRLEQLEQIIFGVGQHLKPRALPIRPVTETFSPQPVLPPGRIVPLNELPVDHDARVYVESRGFSAEWLATKFDVGVCVEAAESRFELMRNRLYIPVTYRQELVGWQCRAVLPQTGPKYLNAPNMRKSALLYNYDQAVKQPFVIVVEGVPSVWRLGVAAVCLFGKSMSFAQQQLITRSWAGKPVFLMLDNDAKVEMERAKNLLLRQSMQVVEVDLPDARDPADYSFSEITGMVMDRAAEAGVLQALA